jgi:putative transposase
VRIPKFRRDSFFPSLLEPRRRIDQDLSAVVCGADVNGVSSGSVHDLLAAIGVEAGISEVSRSSPGRDERVGALRNRTLGHVAFPSAYVDATDFAVRDDAWPGGLPGGRLESAITAKGAREVLGVDIADRGTRPSGRGSVFLEGPGPDRGPPRHLRRPRWPVGSDHEGLLSGLVAAVPGAFRPTPPRPGPERRAGGGDRSLPLDLR